jgi:hypothetical protein
MTDPGVTDADRQEQLRSAVADAPELAAEAVPPADDVPEADGIEQQLTATPGGTPGPRGTDVEADEFDVLEQQADAGGDEEEFRS